jgi:hypothetical protein
MTRPRPEVGIDLIIEMSEVVYRLPWVERSGRRGDCGDPALRIVFFGFGHEKRERCGSILRQLVSAEICFVM